ncbi:sodium:solute symporter family transporter [Candidatus Palauibacter sp.]|uniref:sodium:solute symporter n=1 Tax=Candidatus Palauibacter sp. TaxID=3101350 RepID=UPI003AF290CB
MSAVDWLVFTVYFGAVVAFAWYQSRRNRGVEGFFLANRRMGWGAIGLSVMATQASAITYIGTTGQAFDDGMEFVQFYLGQPIAMVVLCVLFVPFFHRSKIYTAYEYLERRFDAKTRSMTSFLFLMSRGLSAGIVLYAPAIVLSVIMGWDERVTILVMGVITVAYTIMGGITAVIWTDVIQMLVMFAGIGIALAVLFATLPEGVGVADVAYIGGIHEMWKSIDLSWDPTDRYTLWSGLIGGLFLALGYFGTDQSQVQRYLTASSLRQSRLSLIFNAFVKVPMQIFILAIGVLLYVFYHFERPPLVFNSAEVAVVEESERRDEFAGLEAAHERTHELRRAATFELLEARRSGNALASPQRRIAAYDDELERLREESKTLVAEVRGASSNDVNYVFPSYLITYVPAGILGLLIAVIFAAAMSSLDSELTALSSATVIDFYRRHFKPDGSDAHYLLVSRLATLAWGGFAVLFALYVGQLGSLVEAVNEVGSIFYGSLLGVFLLAFLVRRATAAGAFYGLIFAICSVLAVSRFTDIAWLWYNVVGTAIVLLVGSLVSLPARPSDQGRTESAAG